MKLNPAVLIQGLSTFAISLFLAGCEAAPTEVVDELVVAEAKPVKPPQDVGADFELRSFFVQRESGIHGFTDEQTVNDAVAAYLDEEIPTSAQAAPTFSKWGDYLGCPSGELACSSVTLVMNSGKVLGFYAYAAPVVGECGNDGSVPCLLDGDIEYRLRGMLRSSAIVPYLPWELLQPAFDTDADGNRTFRFYWQGQRGTVRRWYTGEEEKVRGKIRPVEASEEHWDLYPDLNPKGAPDRFFPQPGFQTGNLYWHTPMNSETKRLEVCDAEPGCLAEFQGNPGFAGPIASMEQSHTDEGIMEIAVKAILDSGNENPESFGRVMMSRLGPSGDVVYREMLTYEWEDHTVGYRDPDTGEAATWYRPEGLDPVECYRFDLAGLIVLEKEYDSFADDNRWVWDGSGVDPIYVGNNCPPIMTN